MIDHIWSIACSRGVIDNRTNIVSIHDVLEQINIRAASAEKKTLLIRFEVVSFWTRSDPVVPGKGLERLSLWSPSGKKLSTSDPIQLDLSEFVNFRSINTVSGLPLDGEGRYVVKIEFQNEGESRWRKVSAIPIQVMFAPVDGTTPEEKQKPKRERRS